MNNQKTFWITWSVCITTIGISLTLLYTGHLDYGVALFCILPGCIGLFTGFIPKKAIALSALGVALFSVLIIVWSGQLEGLVCIIMAIPLVAGCALIGYLIGLVIRRFTKKTDQLKLSVLPFTFLAITFATNQIWKGDGSASAVTTSMILNASVSTVYDHIKHVDTVIATPHWFHDLGLPYPYKCIMTAEEVGGKRICEFDAGVITETIVELEKNKLLRMAVSDYQMPGKGWFSFKEDRYEVEQVNEGTKITRTTTYLSKLRPRLYWNEIEKLTIGTQQELVFENLKNEVEKPPQ
jgi:hypothetical protein